MICPAHQGAAPLAALLGERVANQLGGLSLAYSRCVLCFEGSAAFELALLSCMEELVALGRRASIALALLTSTSEAQTQVGSSLRQCTQSKEYGVQDLSERC